MGLEARGVGRVVGRGNIRGRVALMVMVGACYARTNMAAKTKRSKSRRRKCVDHSATVLKVGWLTNSCTLVSLQLCLLCVRACVRARAGRSES